MIMRNAVYAGIALLLAILALGTAPVQAGENQMTVYKSPTCGCCKEWVKYMKANGFEMTTYDVKDLGPLKRMSGVTPQLASCHTAFIGDYVVEGHVPADDIKRLLKEKPEAKGLTAPGMPVGSPGMEQGGKKQPYNVLLIGKDGRTRVYARH